MDDWKPDEKVITGLNRLLTKIENPDEPIFGDDEKTYSPRDIDNCITYMT